MSFPNYLRPHAVLADEPPDKPELTAHAPPRTTEDLHAQSPVPQSLRLPARWASTMLSKPWSACAQ